MAGAGLTPARLIATACQPMFFFMENLSATL